MTTIPTMTEAIDIWFNPRCSKARKARELLEERGVELRVRAYLDEAPTRAELETLMQQLGTDDPRTFMRAKEAPYAELGLANASNDTLLDAIVAHPILLERPIVVRGERAVVARPPEKLVELFES